MNANYTSKELTDNSTVLIRSILLENSTIRLDFNAKECLLLLGGSGSGKTSIAMALSGFRSPRVEVSCNEKFFENTSILFQDSPLLDELNILENLKLATLQSSKSSQSSTIEELNWRMEQVGLNPRVDGNKSWKQLSGGQRKRAALALTLALDRKYIILDEPFAGLDCKTAHGIAELLLQIKKLPNAPSILLICHEKEYGLKVADSYIDLDSIEGDGSTVVQQTVSSHPEISLYDNLYRANSSRLKKGNSNQSENTLSTPRKPRVRMHSYKNRIYHDFMVFGILAALLISVSFTATGYAISRQFADLITDSDVASIASSFSDDNANFFSNRWEELKTEQISNFVGRYAPRMKRKVYAEGLSNTFTHELAPLLTALLLAGLLGGAYAGRLSSMQKSRKHLLLRNMKLSPLKWSLFRMLISGIPIGVTGTFLALWLSLVMGQLVGAEWELYKFSGSWWLAVKNTLLNGNLFSKPIMICGIKSLIFTNSIFITSHLLVYSPKASLITKKDNSGIKWYTWKQQSTIRELLETSVPLAVTSAVVVSSVAVILLDVIATLYVW